MECLLRARGFNIIEKSPNQGLKWPDVGDDVSWGIYCTIFHNQIKINVILGIQLSAYLDLNLTMLCTETPGANWLYNQTANQMLF